MMDSFMLHHGGWVLVGDGQKALILQNEGDADLLNLRRVSVRETSNPATREQGTDAPGRSSAPNGTNASAVEQTDWHRIEADRFASALAEDLNLAAQKKLFKELAVVAPPKTLAELRHAFSKDTQHLIVAEIPKDYTHHTIPEIEKLLSSHRPQRADASN